MKLRARGSLATGLALAFLACGPRWNDDPLDRIATAYASLRQRPLEISIERMAYAPWNGDAHAMSGTFGEVAASIVEEAKSHGDDPRWLDAAGVAYLAFGQHAMATRQFQRAIAVAQHEPIYKSHLAAARFLAARSGEPEALIDALAIVDRALHDNPSLVSARFNRALMLQDLGVTTEARRAWLRCRDAAAGSEWAAEAEKRFLHARRPRRTARVTLHDLAGKRVSIARIVEESPQDVRANAEVVFLNEWANSQGSEALDVSRAIGMRLAVSKGECLLMEAVAAIDRGSDGARTSLRSAHRDYYDARILFFNRRSRESEPLFHRAMEKFRSGGSPMELVARYYLANCLYDHGRTSEAHAAVDALLATTPSRYSALRAQLYWLRMSVLTTKGLLNEAHASGSDALAVFTRLGETDNASEVRSALAGLQSLLGRRADAWKTRGLVFGTLNDSDKTAALQRALNSAARSEALFGRWDTARSLLTVALEPSLRVNARLTTSSLVWSALAGMRAGEMANAQREFAEAEKASRKITDETIRAAALAEIRFGRAVFLRGTDPSTSAALMTEFIDWSRSEQSPFLLAEAFLERSRALHTLGRDPEAIADLYNALKWLADRDRENVSYGEAYFATTRYAKRELIDLLDRAGRTRDAFTILGGGKGEHQESLIIAPVVLQERLLVFVAPPGEEVRTLRITASESSIAAAVAEIGRCSESDDARCAEPAASLLGRLLLQPLAKDLERAKSIVIAPDEVLAVVPFAMLDAGQRRLIERVPIAISVAARVRSLAQQIHRDQQLLVVSNPAFDEAVFPNLPRLPGANVEARAIARLYARPVLLAGRAATKAAVIEQLRSAEVAQIATHGIASSADPSQSCLVLASDHAESGALYVHEIATMRLPRLRLVILTGCRTAVPSTAAAEGESIALGFLRAGAESVVGSLWDIDDEVASYAGLALHRELLAGARPADALQRVQTAMIHSSDPRLRAPRAWAGLRLFVKDK